MTNGTAIRSARPDDAVQIGIIEASAGELFRTLPDVAWIADEPSDAPDSFLPLIAEGTVWMAEHPPGIAAGILIAEAIDAELHVWELAVARSAQQQGLGRALLDAACAFAKATGLRAVTLTTFRHVAWNAPFYARHGFVELGEAEMGARLRAIIAEESARGLPNRCAMSFTLPRPGERDGRVKVARPGEV
jgi:GNAT superfamily N-acetyltransferase